MPVISAGPTLPGSVESAEAWAEALFATGSQLMEEGWEQAAADVFTGAGELDCWVVEHGG